MSSRAPLLKVDGLVKRYRGGAWPRRHTTFTMEVDLEVEGPGIVGVMGANGAGKTTLFELVTGSNHPSSGRVLIGGQDIHRVRYDERSHLAMHYHQSYQLRSFQRRRPTFTLERAASPAPRVHLFDEPQFNLQDGYIGFMLDFFRALRRRDKLVFLCLHPNEPVHLDILSEVCERFLFVHKDDAGTSRLTQATTLERLAQDTKVRSYLGRLWP